MNSGPPIINLKDINFSHPGGKAVLNHLDFKFYNGDRMGLVAPNGSGKTTLFHLIMGLNKPTSGDMELFGKTVTTAKDFEEVRRRIGLLFQDPDDQLFSPTVIEDVAFGPLNLGKSKEKAQNIARRTLANLGLEGFEDRITFKLSGGEKRLVSLATVLAMEPDVLLLDEPLTGLDSDTSSKIVEIISNLDQSYIIISHDIDFLLYTTNQICSIKHGQIIFEDESQIHVHRHVHPHGRYPHKHG
ncbi:MAG: ABC transporter ATP-binding protein [Deltaproteobacteria bacterium]|jgi:cobalt/nickel transport system ATP-binding protein|nr:ABC transporter ATP-binding protein [Deltaproteobacteria bacterium]